MKKKGGLRKSRPNQMRELDYATMPIASIFELLDKTIFSLADLHHAVFLWTIEDFLIESDIYMQRRSYKRHCRFVWDKTNGVAPAFTVRYTHEYLIWYYKEKMLPVATEYRGKFRTVFTEKARQHSRKPDFAYQMINCLYPGYNKIDVFSREKRKDWDQFVENKYKLYN
jgi:N6-adenosine-specific RNA methylase IME4